MKVELSKLPMEAKSTTTIFYISHIWETEQNLVRWKQTNTAWVPVSQSFQVFQNHQGNAHEFHEVIVN